MRTTTLRRSGGSVIVSLPKFALDQLGLEADTPVEIDVEGDSIVIRRRRHLRIGLAQRLAMSNFDLQLSAEEKEWEAAPVVGREWGGSDEADK
jgi:antitoxin ChpS